MSKNPEKDLAKQLSGLAHSYSSEINERKLKNSLQDLLEMELSFELKDKTGKPNLQLTEESKQKINKFFEGVPYNHPDGTPKTYGEYYQNLVTGLANNSEKVNGKEVRQQYFEMTNIAAGKEFNSAYLQELTPTTKDNHYTFTGSISSKLLGDEKNPNLDLLYNVVLASDKDHKVSRNGGFSNFGAISGDEKITSQDGKVVINLFNETPEGNPRPKNFGLSFDNNTHYGAVTSIEIDGKKIDAKGYPDHNSGGKFEKPDIFVSQSVLDDQGRLKDNAKFYVIQQSQGDLKVTVHLSDKDKKHHASTGNLDELKFVIAESPEAAQAAYLNTWGDKEKGAKQIVTISQVPDVTSFTKILEADKYVPKPEVPAKGYPLEISEVASAAKVTITNVYKNPEIGIAQQKADDLNVAAAKEAEKEANRSQTVQKEQQAQKLAEQNQTKISTYADSDKNLLNTIVNEHKPIGMGKNRISSGDAVKELQQSLKDIGQDIEVTGTFDAKTKAAVEKFQRDNHLVPDGVVGSQTLSGIQVKQLAALEKKAKEGGFDDVEKGQLKAEVADLSSSLGSLADIKSKKYNLPKELLHEAKDLISGVSGGVALNADDKKGYNKYITAKEKTAKDLALQ